MKMEKSGKERCLLLVLLVNKRSAGLSNRGHEFCVVRVADFSSGQGRGFCVVWRGKGARGARLFPPCVCKWCRRAAALRAVKGSRGEGWAGYILARPLFPDGSFRRLVLR